MIVCRVKVPNTKKEIILFGASIDSYVELPIWVRNIIEACDTLFLPGRNGLSFTEPFSCPDALFNTNNSNYLDWHSRLSEQDIRLIKLLVKFYTEGYYDLTPDENNYKLLRFWSVKSLIDNIQECLYGDELNIVLFKLFLTANKTMVSMDEDEVLQRQQKMVRLEQYLHMLQQNTKRSIATEIIKTSLERVRNLFPSSDSDSDTDSSTSSDEDHAVYSGHDRPIGSLALAYIFVTWFRSIIVISHQKYRKSLSARKNLYENYMAKLYRYLGSVDLQEKETICWHMNPEHLVQIMSYFAHQDWEMEIIVDNYSASITDKSKALLFSLQLERRAYATIRESIIYPSTNPDRCYLKF